MITTELFDLIIACRQPHGLIEMLDIIIASYVIETDERTDEQSKRKRAGRTDEAETGSGWDVDGWTETERKWLDGRTDGRTINDMACRTDVLTDYS